MRSFSGYRTAVLVTGFLCVATFLCTTREPAQASDRSGTATPSPVKIPDASNTASNQPVKLGVWQRFGTSNNAPKVIPNKSRGWRRFSSAGSAPKPISGLLTTPRAQQLGTSRIADLEMQMFDLVNNHRSNPANAAETGGRALPLRWDEQLAAVARAHSRDMLAQGYFDHVDPEGRSPAMRVKAAGIPWQASGENIALYAGVASAEAAFMNEPRFEHNHRANILNPRYNEVGIGIVQGRDGMYYITQEFIEAPTDLPSSAESLSAGNAHGQ